MTLVCPAPDSAAGVAITLSDYLDCQARALGESGFQALAGGPLGMSLLTGLLTIFIGLIGYRLILGETPGIRDGIGWTVRVGLVLALVTSWPAFQTLFYRVVTDGPAELAAIVLPASGLPADGLDGRVQHAYDTIRMGSSLTPAPLPAAAAPVEPSPTPTLPAPLLFQPPMPQTASLFVLTTSGFAGAFRIAVGFLLAVAPLAIMALLFDATLSIFTGWVRALTGMAFASLAAVVVTAIELLAVEGELAHLQAMRFGGSMRGADPQALMTIVIVFALVMLVSTLAAMRMTGAFRLPLPRMPRLAGAERSLTTVTQPALPFLRPAEQLAGAPTGTTTQARAAQIAEALAATVRREQTYRIEGSSAGGAPRQSGNERAAGSTGGFAMGLGTIGRRSVGRRTRSAARRDRVGS